MALVTGLIGYAIPRRFAGLGKTRSAIQQKGGIMEPTESPLKGGIEEVEPKPPRPGGTKVKVAEVFEPIELRNPAIKSSVQYKITIRLDESTPSPNDSGWLEWGEIRLRIHPFDEKGDEKTTLLLTLYYTLGPQKPPVEALRNAIENKEVYIYFDDVLVPPNSLKGK